MQCLASVLLQRKLYRAYAHRKIDCVHDPVGHRHRFVAPPYAGLVEDEINAHTTVMQVVSTDQFHHAVVALLTSARQWNHQLLSIAGQTVEVKIECERLSFINPDCAESAPPVQETGLSGRQANFVDGKHSAVMKDKFVHDSMPFWLKSFVT